MEFYLLLGSIGIVILLLFFFSLTGKSAKKAVIRNPIVESNIASLKNSECLYAPEMNLQLRRIKGEKKYNDLIDAIGEQIYDLNTLFNKLRYHVERTEYGEFMTADNIFKSIIDDKEIEGFERDKNEEKEILEEVKNFNMKKRKIEKLMVELLDRTMKMKRESA